MNKGDFPLGDCETSRVQCAANGGKRAVASVAGVSTTHRGTDGAMPSTPIPDLFHSLLSVFIRG